MGERVNETGGGEKDMNWNVCMDSLACQSVQQ